MRHVQRLGNQGRIRTIAGALAVVAGLALFSVAGAPGAVGQLATVNVGNDGGASAGTGGNSATGNASSNNIQGTSTTGGLVGGLIDANVSLGAPSNNSDGSAAVDSGPANASGNQSDTAVSQASSGGSGSGFNPGNPFQPAPGNSQSANVTNTGGASANTGGNTAVGNNSQNTITSDAGVGLVDADISLGGATNNSTGSAAINTGPANAVGNRSGNAVNQAQIGDDDPDFHHYGHGYGYGAHGGPGHYGPGGYYHATPFYPGVFPGTVTGYGSSFDPCSGRFFPFAPFFNGSTSQSANVHNAGAADANTGDNTAIGNNSTNNAVVNQTASGGLIGLNVNLGSPTNNSTGTATINTGEANASGNESTTTINQFCGPTNDAGDGAPFMRNPITGGPIVVPHVPTPTVVAEGTAQPGTLARTGYESGVAVLAMALVLFGAAMVVAARRRLAPARASDRGAVSSREWDSVVRW